MKLYMRKVRQLYADWVFLMSSSDENVWCSSAIFWNNLNMENTIYNMLKDQQNDFKIAGILMLTSMRTVRNRYFY